VKVNNLTAVAAGGGGCRDPFLLDRPSADNGWRWRVMVGSNINMAALAAQAAAEPPASPATPAGVNSMTAARAAATGATAAAGMNETAATAAGEDQLAGISRAEEERQQLKRAAAALAAAGWIGEGRGLPGGLTLGTATVYRSKGKELEGGALQLNIMLHHYPVIGHVAFDIVQQHAWLMSAR
jgi:hypothetical protein